MNDENVTIKILWDSIYGQWPDKKKKTRVIKPEDAKITCFWEKGTPPQKTSVYVSTENLTAGVFVLSPGAWSAGSRHQGDEYYYILEGVLTIKINGLDMYDVHQGEGFLIAAKDEHEVFNFTENLCRISYVISGGL